MPLCMLGLDGCVLHRGAKRLSSSPSEIRFPSLQNTSLSITGHSSSVLLISMKRRFHFHWRKPFLFRHRPAGGPWPGYRQYSSRVALLSYSSLLHTLKPFSKQWQHYLQDSYKTGFVRTKNNKAVLSFFFSPPYRPPPCPKCLSLPVQNSDTFPKRHLYLSISTEPANDNSPGTRTAVRRRPEEQQSSLSTFVKWNKSISLGFQCTYPFMVRKESFGAAEAIFTQGRKLRVCEGETTGTW